MWFVPKSGSLRFAVKNLNIIIASFVRLYNIIIQKQNVNNMLTVDGVRFQSFMMNFIKNDDSDLKWVLICIN